METLKASVIGTGNMGKNHIRVLSSMKDIDLVAVSDINISSAEESAKSHNCKAYKFYEQMIKEEKPDIVSVVVPTSMHSSVGSYVLSKTNALIEKPIALNDADAAKIIAARDQYGHKLMIGQIERFNPVIEYLQNYMQNEEFLAFNVMRLGPYIPSVRTTGVLMDMGIHDIDMIRHITKTEPVSVHASYRHIKIGDFEDQAHVFMKMPGPSASLICNWISPIKIRHIYAVTDKAFIYLDLISQKGSIEEVKDGNQKSIAIELPYEEPLLRELNAFVDCVRNDLPSVVSAEDALQSVRIALRANKIAQRSDPHIR